MLLQNDNKFLTSSDFVISTGGGNLKISRLNRNDN